MIDDHICDGDLILLERVTQARDGDIVVALVAGSDTTLKRFYREPGDMVRLQPANATLQTDIGSCQGCANSGPVAGRPAKVQVNGELLDGEQFLLGAEPIFFGGAALTAASFPIGIGQARYGVLERLRGNYGRSDNVDGLDFRFRLRSSGNAYSRTRDALRTCGLAASRRSSCAGCDDLLLGDTAF